MASAITTVMLLVLELDPKGLSIIWPAASSEQIIYYLAVMEADYLLSIIYDVPSPACNSIPRLLSIVAEVASVNRSII